MSTDPTLEGQNDWTTADQPDGLEDAGTIGEMFRDMKAWEKARLDQEHFWRWYSSNSSLYNPEAEGAHKPKAGRCDNLDWTAFTGDSEHAPDAEWTKGKIVRIVSNVGSADDPIQVNGTAWIKKVSSGYWVPLIKQLRGMTWVSGGLVFRPLENGWHDHNYDQIWVDDEDGVGEGGVIDYVVFEPTHSSWQGYEAWTFKLYGGDWEHDNHGGGNEALVLEYGKTSSGDNWSRIGLTKEGIVFEKGASVDELLVDGVDVSEHKHTGAAGDGEVLSYQSIENTDASRICRITQASISSGTISTIDRPWIEVGSFTVGEVGDSDSDIYELDLQVKISHNSNNDGLRELVLVALANSVASGSPSPLIAMGDMYYTDAIDGGSYGNVTFVIPSIASGITPTINHGDTVKLFVRKPSGPAPATEVSANITIRTWRR